MSGIQNLTIKRPEKEDVADLLPVFVAVVVFAITSGKGKKSLIYLLPTIAAFVAWLLVKGLRYVPR